MRNLYIIGARGFGREVYNLFLDCKDSMGDVECKGFLDDKTDALDGYPNYPPIIGSVEEFTPGENDVFVCALGDVNYKRKYVEIIQSKGGRFISLIHPTVVSGINSPIGIGCIIRAEATISCDVCLGNFVTIMAYTAIGHDSKIGDWCHLGAHSFMGGFSVLEESVTLHPSAKILPHKRVGAGATVGAGSVVIRNVKPGLTVFGMPATKI